MDFIKIFQKFYSEKSVKSSCLISFFLGSSLKILVIIFAAFYFSIYGIFQGGGDLTIDALKRAYPSGIETRSFYGYFSAITAPFIENLFLPLTIWLSSKFKAARLIEFLGISGLMYVGHAGFANNVSAGITGAVLFSFMFVQYVAVLNIRDKRHAYWYTVITHFAFNLMTFAFIHLMNFIIFYVWICVAKNTIQSNWTDPWWHVWRA